MTNTKNNNTTIINAIKNLHALVNMVDDRVRPKRKKNGRSGIIDIDWVLDLVRI